MGLFSVGKKKKKEDKEEVILKSDQIVFDSLESDQDAYLINLATQLRNGQPLILNFEKLDIDQANKAIAFLSGVVFAIAGEIVNVKDKVFMFAAPDVYEDGSMEEFLSEIVE